MLILCVLCASVAILPGCGREKEVGRNESVLRIGGLGGPPGPINAIISNSTISANLADLVYSPLVRINARMLPEPALAERWEVSPDGLTYTFYIRKAVRFHDGTELTAEDCAFTYNAVLDPATKSPWRENYNMIKTVSAENSYTFRVTLKEPQASFINLMNFPIHPVRTGRPTGTTSNGAGPFKFVRRTADDRIILEANPDYYEGKPNINRIEARGYDTFSQYFSAFMKGEIDFCLFLSPEQYQTVARDPAFRTYRFPSIYTYMIDYNPDHPLFKDKKVRQAMAHVINISEVINKVESGLGIQSTGPFLPGAWFSNPDVKPLEYNPAEAMRLLDECGVRSVECGMKDSAFPIPHSTFVLLVDPKERTTEQIARLIYQDLYKIGIRCEIKTYDHLNQDKELIKEAGAAVTSIRILSDLEPSWHSSKQKRVDKLWKYVNPEIDALFERADTTQDLKERTKLYHELHRMVYEDQSGTFLYNLPNLAAINKRFGNTDELFSAAMPFYTIKDWNISHRGTENTEPE